VIPLDCFHAVPLKLNDPTAAVPSAEKPTSTVLWETCGKNPCLAVLLGIHFMVHLDDNDPLHPNAPWIFMTFWWTGEDNGSHLPEPWKYYSVSATQDPRNDSAQDGSRGIIFNPYLEGVHQNGAVANCVTCHAFAAMDGKNPKNSLVGLGVGVCFGGPPIPRVASYAGKPCTPDQYFQPGIVSADRIWSLAHLNDSPQRGKNARKRRSSRN
jgi:hypothetical protein